MRQRETRVMRRGYDGIPQSVQGIPAKQGGNAEVISSLTEGNFCQGFFVFWKG